MSDQIIPLRAKEEVSSPINLGAIAAGSQESMQAQLDALKQPLHQTPPERNGFPTLSIISGAAAQLLTPPKDVTEPKIIPASPHRSPENVARTAAGAAIVGGITHEAMRKALEGQPKADDLATKAGDVVGQAFKELGSKRLADLVASSAMNAAEKQVFMAQLQKLVQDAAEAVLKNPQNTTRKVGVGAMEGVIDKLMSEPGRNLGQEADKAIRAIIREKMIRDLLHDLLPHHQGFPGSRPDSEKH